MIVISPTTVLNPSALETRHVPRRFFGRALVLPKSPGGGDLWRLVFELQFLRYVGALLPFVIAMFTWPHLALPISQAPLAMVIVIGFVELKVFRLSADARAVLMEADDAARVLDELRFRGTAILRDIAAGRDMRNGELILVVEQSELARIRPLTFVSVQRDGARPEVLALTDAEQARMHELFDDAFPERVLHLANLQNSEMLRSVALDARGVSAHARLAARLAGREVLA